MLGSQELTKGAKEPESPPTLPGEQWGNEATLPLWSQLLTDWVCAAQSASARGFAGQASSCASPLLCTWAPGPWAALLSPALVLCRLLSGLRSNLPPTRLL